MSTVDGTFARRAREYPERIAVRDQEGELTYAELDARANQAARYLLGLGIRPGEVVGIHVRRSTELITLLLAVLKVGAAYVALHPGDPVQRKDTILRAASVRFVLTDEDSADFWPSGCGVVRLAEHRPRITAQSAAPLAAASGPEHVAYVAFTSGSTGHPKGVCVPHRAVVRLVVGADFVDIRPDDVFLQFAPVAFDASTFEIWGALLSGARLVLAPSRDLSVADLIAFVLGESITIMWLTAGLFHRAAGVDLTGLRGLRYLLAGGDVLSTAHVARVVAALPNTVVINGYGPTENTTFTCCHPIHGDPGERAVPIGVPIHGTEVRILDERLRPVADGEIGELYAVGDGLAHGYLGATTLTATRFVADPFAQRPGQRMYRTGDLVRRTDDGYITFIGRTDDQVKLRGFRVEIGEVEAALNALSAVTAAAVVAVTATGGEFQLIAYVVTLDRLSPTTAELRKELSALLPSYAVPALMYRTESLPLNSQGKVDRAAIRNRGTLARPEVNAVYREPDSVLEKLMVELWTDHLGILGIGADDDFVELGGNSLIAVDILEELRNQHGVRLSPLEFYLNPNPAALSAVFDQRRNEQ